MYPSLVLQAEVCAFPLFFFSSRDQPQTTSHVGRLCLITESQPLKSVFVDAGDRAQISHGQGLCFTAVFHPWP